MTGLACARCHKFMRRKKIGVVIEEGMPIRQPDGSDGWGPYKLWHADLVECPECGAKMITGFAQRPLAEHYEKTYAQQRERFSPLFRVDDCGGMKP